MRRFDAMSARLAGTNVVEASAGTGKTYAISTLLLRLLLEEHLSIDQILVVTFTEAATAELRARIRGRMRAALRAFDAPADDPVLRRLVSQSADPARDRLHLFDSLHRFDEAVISTIHGFCHRMLHDSTFESGIRFDTELVDDQRPLLDEVLFDFWSHEIEAASRGFARHLQHSKTRPNTLRALVRRAAQYTSIPVLPEASSVGESADRDAIEQAYGQIRSLWRKDGTKLAAELEQLREQGVFKLKAYREGLSRMFPVIDLYLEAPEHVGRLAPEELRSFTSAKLAKAVYAKMKQALPRHMLFGAIEHLLACEQTLQSAYDARVMDMKRRLVDFVRDQLPSRKAAHSIQSFDDLLQQLDGALSRPGGERLAGIIRSRFGAALIDEFQDTDPVQYRIFRTIYGDTDLPLYLIGDPKQAIYAFRGADVFAYLEAVSDAGDRKLTMDTNWRSDPGLVQAVNHLFEGVERPFVLAGIDYPPVAPHPDARERLEPGALDPAPLQIRFVEHLPDRGKKQIDKSWAARQLAPLVADEVSTLLRSGATIDQHALGPGDVAILTRTNAQARDMQRALRELRIPAVLYGDMSVFETTEAEELHRILRAIAEPTRWNLLKAAITTHAFGATANDLDGMDRDETKWEAWLGRFRSWNAMWADRGFIRMFHAMLGEHGVHERLLGMPDGERRMTNWLHLAELLHTAARSQHLGPMGLLLWLGAERKQARLSRPETRQIRLESDEDAVKLATVHKAKGLEYPVVYCTHLWDGNLLFTDEHDFLLFHDRDDDHALKLDLGSADKDEHVEEAKRERLAENLRLLYVAVTRAKHRCTVFWGRFKNAETSPLGYLLHAPPGAGGTGPFRGAIQNRVKHLDDDGVWTELEAHVERSGGLFGLAKLEPSDSQPYRAPVADALELRWRAVEHPADQWWRTASFSQLTSARGSAIEPDPTEGRDRDELAVDSEPPRGLGADVPVVLHEFPRGAKAGNFFHEVFEHLDFCFDQRRELEAIVARRLPAYGYSEDWLGTVCRSIEDVLDTPLGPDGPKLRAVSQQHRLDELEFMFPIAGGVDADLELGSLTQAKLADVFRTQPGLPGGYADQVERLRFLPLHGFLKGYIDLVFRDGDRHYVVDYKSNYLGPSLAAYASARLPAAMMHSHYYLQYHLYSVAVHRYLSARLQDYDYDRHFGGTYYLFIRGMSPAAGSDFGVFHERPPRARIEALSSLLADPLQHHGVSS